MSTFAVTDNSEVLGSINYLLSNLNTGNTSGNITVPDGTLIANATTGEITQYNVAGDVYGYVNQYVNLRYATNSSGTAGFSEYPTNATYFGVYNSTTSTPSSNPAAYVWREVSGGFGTTKTIYYSAIGGRQVLWAAASSAPSSNYVVSVANVAIDLDVVTTAAGTPGERGPIAMAYVVTTADPNTATSSQLTSWFEAARDASTPPIGTGLTPISGDTATFIYGAGAGTPSGTFSFNGSTWLAVVGQVVSGNVIVDGSITGNAIANATLTGNLYGYGSISGDRISTNTIEGTNIALDTITGDKVAAATITGGKIAANTITATNISAATITGDKIAANTITATNISAATITGDLIAANTINANSLQANSITATQISSAYIYAGNIVSQTATLGNTSSTGYWLRYTDGAARFGGNVSIGNNASIGGNLTVTGLVTAGSLNSNTVVTATIVPSSISVAGSYNTLSTYQQLTPSLSTWYYDSSNVSITTTQTNQSVYLFGTIQNQVTTAQLYSPARVWSLTYDIALFRKSGASYTMVGDYQRYTLTNQASTVANSPVEVTPFVGYLDIPVTASTYDYMYGMRYVSAANVVVPSFEFETRNILAQQLKR